MTKVRKVIERFYERFGAGNLSNAFACSAPDCIAVGLSGPVPNDEHMAAARRLKSAMPDCRMEVIRTLEAGDEIPVTGRFKGPHKNDLQTPLGTIVAAGKTLDLLFVDYFRVENGRYDRPAWGAVGAKVDQAWVKTDCPGWVRTLPVEPHIARSVAARVPLCRQAGFLTVMVVPLESPSGSVLAPAS